MEYNFYIDNKATVWTRSYRRIEASSEEEAKELAKKLFKEELSGWVSGDGEYENETLTDTFESMSVEENGGCSTEELIWPGGLNKDIEVIMDNIPVEIKRDEKIEKLLSEK